MAEPTLSKKILIVTLKFPFPMTGACETDCGRGILQFIRLGFKVKVITRIARHQSKEAARKISEKLGIEIIPVPYRFDTKAPRIQKFKKYIIRFFTNPLILDGAAFEYNDPGLKKILKNQLKNWQPNLVWFDCSQMWPLYGIVRKQAIPIITRSRNFEPLHFLGEHGYNIVNFFRFLPKFLGEIMTIRKSDLLFAITPREARIYKKLGAKNVKVLPGRGLLLCLKQKREIDKKEKLNVFFWAQLTTFPI